MTIEELRQNKLELLGKLVAGLGHEVRNPLSAIRLNLDYMEMFSDELAPDIVDSINSSKEALQRIESLINTILNFVKDKIDEEKIPLEKIINNAIDLSVIKARSKEIRILPEIEEKSACLLQKPGNLLQVILNLISNAIEACDPGGKIVVGSSFDDYSKETTIYVEDNGCGIPDDKVELIFDEFFTTKKEGTGLGLYVCKYLLEDYNAELKVESELGKGSKFIIKISEGE